MKKTLKIASLLSMSFCLLLLAAGCSLTEKKDVSETNDLQAETSEKTEAKTLSEEDVFGEDFANIPRYTDSVRTYFAKDEYETDITYETTDSEEKVREFYNNLLTKDGWEQIGIATDYIDFEKGDQDNPEILTVYFEPYEDEGYLEYELVYSPPLTEEELAELEEEDSMDFEDIELE